MQITDGVRPNKSIAWGGCVEIIDEVIGMPLVDPYLSSLRCG